MQKRAGALTRLGENAGAYVEFVTGGARHVDSAGRESQSVRCQINVTRSGGPNAGAIRVQRIPEERGRVKTSRRIDECAAPKPRPELIGLIDPTTAASRAGRDVS